MRSRLPGSRSSLLYKTEPGGGGEGSMGGREEGGSRDGLAVLPIGGAGAT